MCGLSIVRALRHGITIHPDFVHADIKPENVLVTSGSDYKLTDFGLATVLPRVGENRHWPLRGTFMYMAPEIIAGQGWSLSSDLYSLGCLLFEMLAGEPVYGWLEHQHQYLDMHLQAKPREVTDVRKDVPSTLRRLIYGLLEKNPHSRASLDDAIRILTDLMREFKLSMPEETRPAPTAEQMYEAATGFRVVQYYDDALRLFERLRDQDDLDLDIRINALIELANIHIETGNWQAAASTLRDCGELISNSHSNDTKARYYYLSGAYKYRYYLSGAYKDRGHEGLTEAAADIKRALQLDPDNLRYREELANTLIRGEDYESALKVAEDGFKLGVSTLMLREKYVICALALRRRDDAMACAEQAIRLFPSGWAHALRCLVYELSGFSPDTDLDNATEDLIWVLNDPATPSRWAGQLKDWARNIGFVIPDSPSGSSRA